MAMAMAMAMARRPRTTTASLTAPPLVSAMATQMRDHLA